MKKYLIATTALAAFALAAPATAQLLGGGGSLGGSIGGTLGGTVGSTTGSIGRHPAQRQSAHRQGFGERHGDGFG
jgi:hypothetical protein